MDDEHLPPLGPEKAWLVKDFPVGLREEITRAAAGQGVTVGKWLVAHFQRFGIGGVEITAVKFTDVKRRLNFDELVTLASRSNLPRWLQAPARRELGQLLGVEPPAPPRRTPRIASDSC